ncbi:MAG: hypothetical protein MI824_00895, partial [Hyphomicrobiales bacterium]|nr:hypothetical protein [Hyphomicrobiales bacterium]
MAAVINAYRDAFSLIERLHRRFLDVLRSELDRMDVEDINNVQSLILFNIGNDELTVGKDIVADKPVDEADELLAEWSLLVLWNGLDIGHRLG